MTCIFDVHGKAGRTSHIFDEGATTCHCGGLQKQTEIPPIAITCDHRGGPGAIDEDGTFNEYHCAACCTAVCVGASGEFGPCTMHPEGAAVALLEARPLYPHPRLGITTGWTNTEEGRSIVLRPQGNFSEREVCLSVEDAEQLAVNLLQTIGAARRGDQ